MIDRLACSRQGVPALLDGNDFMCDRCRESRDMVCSNCTTWEHACATSSGTKLKESVETLARYLVKEAQLAAQGDGAVATMTAGVAKASCVIILCSRAYKLSSSCRAESLHASKVNKPIFCLKCEEWDSDGWLKSFMKGKTTLDYRDESQLDEVFTGLQDVLGPPPETVSLSRTRSALSRTRSMSFDAMTDGSSKANRLRAAPSGVRFSRTTSSRKEDGDESQSSGSALVTDDTTLQEKVLEPFAPKKGTSASLNDDRSVPDPGAGNAELTRSVSRTSTRSTFSSVRSSDLGRQKRKLPSSGSSPALRPQPSVSPTISAQPSSVSQLLGSSNQSGLVFALDDGEEDMPPNLSTISRTQSVVSVHEHIDLLHKSVNAQKDAELMPWDKF